MSDLHRWVQLSPDTIAATERLETPPPHYGWTNGMWPDVCRELRARVDELGVLIHELQTMHNTAVDWRMEQDRRLNQLEATQHAHIEAPAPTPAGSLVERVADAIAAQATSAGIVNDRPARAAILEVAAWLLQNGWPHASDALLEQEATR